MTGRSVLLRRPAAQSFLHTHIISSFSGEGIAPQVKSLVCNTVNYTEYVVPNLLPPHMCGTLSIYTMLTPIKKQK